MPAHRLLIRALIIFYEWDLGRKATATGKLLDFVNEVSWAIGWDKNGVSETMVQRELRAYRKEKDEFERGTLNPEMVFQED